MDHKGARVSAVHLCPVRRVTCVVRMDYISGGPVGGRPIRAKFSVPSDKSELYFSSHEMEYMEYVFIT